VEADVNAEEEEEKRRLISQVLELQNTLDGSNLLEFCVLIYNNRKLKLNKILNNTTKNVP